MAYRRSDYPAEATLEERSRLRAKAEEGRALRVQMAAESSRSETEAQARAELAAEQRRIREARLVEHRARLTRLSSVSRIGFLASWRLALYMVWPAFNRFFDFDGVSDSYRTAAAQTGSLLFPGGEAWRAAWALDPNLDLGIILKGKRPHHIL